MDALRSEDSRRGRLDRAVLFNGHVHLLGFEVVEQDTARAATRS